MVQSKSTSRLSRLNKLVILTQTDTTVGFVSQNASQLYEIKSREITKPFIKVYANFKTLNSFKHRIPSKQKNLVRRSKKTTFIVKNKAFRVAKTPSDSYILQNLDWVYSTSANESGKSFVFDFCEAKTDIIILNKEGLHEKSSSSLFKINQRKKVRIR